MVQLTLGFWLPVLASAALEARAYRRWKQVGPQQQHAVQQQRDGQAQQQEQEQQGQQAPGGKPPWAKRQQLRVYRLVNAMLDGEDLTWPALGALALAETWDLLALATQSGD